MRHLLAAVLLAGISGCASPTDPGPATSAITLRFGQAATVGGARISFTDVDDSRCPKGVACVWAGDAAVRLESGAESVVLHTNGTVGAATSKLAGATVTLTEVRPEPVASNPAKKTDYEITLRVSQ